METELQREPTQTEEAVAGIRSAPDSGRMKNEWSRWLTAEQRAEIRKLHKIRPVWNLNILGYWFVWAGTGVLMFTMPLDGLWRLPCYLVMALCINALAMMMHEAIHDSTFRKPVLDRVSGFLCTVPVLLSGYAYKVVHELHHSHVRSPNDPDDYRNASKSKAVQQFVFYVSILVGGLLYLVHMPLTAILRGSPRERRFVVFEYCLLAAIYATVWILAARFDFTAVLIQCWLLPLLIVIMLSNVRGWSEHAMTDDGDPLRVSRTVISNRVVFFLMCGLNYHVEHHLFPRIPWYNLPRVHALLKDQYEEAGTSIYKSYLRFLWDGLRTGVHGRAPRLPGADDS